MLYPTKSKREIDMKKKIIVLLAICINISYFCYAQSKKGDLRKVKSLQVAYITKELALTPEESEKFWPVYNNYKNELKSTRKEENDDQIELEEKVLNTRKKYKADFKRILGSDDRVNKLFVAEKSFRDMLRAELKNRRSKRSE